MVGNEERKAALKEVNSKIERNMMLLGLCGYTAFARFRVSICPIDYHTLMWFLIRIEGATAIEDKLQEQVPETLKGLRATSMKVRSTPAIQ